MRDPYVIRSSVEIAARRDSRQQRPLFGCGCGSSRFDAGASQIDRVEAQRVATEVAERYREQARDELVRLLREQDTFEVAAESGNRYQLEVQAFWDDRKGNNLRVRIAIDDGGRSAYHPLVIDFIVAPDGSLVGE